MHVTIHFDEAMNVTESDIDKFLENNFTQNNYVVLHEVVSVHSSTDTTPAQCTVDLYGENMWSEVIEISQNTPMVFKATKNK